MKILLVTNKTYRGQLDGGYWYTYLPLQALGHDVYFYNTVDPIEKDFNKVIESFKPDLIFCCLTGNPGVAPAEPWYHLENETASGRTQTYNFFCDDTWRFENFSRIACHFFNACSTPEPSFMARYKNIGYSNIILGNWHVNLDLYPALKYQEKDIDISFMGAMTPVRQKFFDASPEVPVEMFCGISHQQMMEIYARSRIGVNLSVNENDPNKKTQMKQRMFEVPAGGALLVTQYHSGIEQFFEIEKEIITFEEPGEYVEKMEFFSKKPKIVEAIASAGHRRFLAEHESKIRLSTMLEQIRNF